MTYKKILNIVVSGCFLLSACSPVDVAVKEQYKLVSLTSERAAYVTPLSILVTQPEAVAGYQTEQMLYMKKPYELSYFIHNAWISSPPNMLYPLMITSLQNTHYFSAVASGAYADKTDYRLDTLMLAFQQNFLSKPSQFDFTVKVTLTHVEDARIIASKMISLRIPCSEETPYGGVMAANQASAKLTALVSKFVMQHIASDIKHKG